MTAALEIDLDRMQTLLIELLNTPSPTGFTDRALDYLEGALAHLPLEVCRTRKGTLVATWPGRSASAPRALTAHVDTLGAMVKEVNVNGRLRLTRVGGFAWNTVEGEGVSVFTAAGRVIRGTLLVTKPSSHVHGPETGQMKREDDTMEVRLDERTTSVDETRALGIQVGDFVAFDPRVETGPAGFIRSRHLDDKASVAAIFGAVWALQVNGLQPAQRTTLHFSHYEEVGHGAAAGFPADLAELISVDMAAIGQGQASDEFDVTICVKDSGGPYDLALRRRLVRLAEDAGIPYKLDVFPYYGSDGEAYWRAGGDVRVALLGPGVEASHSYERTHTDALVRTAQLLAEYLRHAA
ncbi:MAG: M42 family metallopeptidase [Anaerolineales bacterium]|nr:M42 family metallopeptidase [Anaerolineales bacterium]